MNGATGWLDEQIRRDLESGVVWQQQRARVMAGFGINNQFPVPNAWPEGEAETNQEIRDRIAARWRHKEACSRHWWNLYWTTVSDIEAYAAWTLFLGCADRRAYEWMDVDFSNSLLESATLHRRQSHFRLNFSALKSAIKKQEKELSQNFLGRRTFDGIGPWSAR
jgi:hypothetical protein